MTCDFLPLTETDEIEGLLASLHVSRSRLDAVQALNPQLVGAAITAIDLATTGLQAARSGGLTQMALATRIDAAIKAAQHATIVAFSLTPQAQPMASPVVW